MNPAFIVIAILVCVCVWFLAAFLYKPIGRLFYRVGKDAIDSMAEDDKNEKEKDKL